MFSLPVSNGDLAIQHLLAGQGEITLNNNRERTVRVYQITAHGINASADFVLDAGMESDLTWTNSGGVTYAPLWPGQELKVTCTAGELDIWSWSVAMIGEKLLEWMSDKRG